MTVDPATRRANLWTLLALIVFSVGLCVTILWWMRHVTLRNGGTVYPPPPAAATSYLPIGHPFHHLT